MDHIKIKHVVFYVALKPSGNLMLAEMDDGAFYLVRDDTPLTDRRWPHEEAAEAVKAYQRMKQQLVKKGEIRS